MSPDDEFRRLKNLFKKNRTELDVPPLILSVHDIWERVQAFPKVSEEQLHKFDGYDVSYNRTKKSIFLKLEYWQDKNLDIILISCMMKRTILITYST